MCRSTVTASRYPPTTSSLPIRTALSSYPATMPPRSSSSHKSSTTANIRCIHLLKNFIRSRRRSNSLDEFRTEYAVYPITRLSVTELDSNIYLFHLPQRRQSEGYDVN